MTEHNRPYFVNRFKNSNYDQLSFPGPRPGEPAPEFTVWDLDGNEVKLSDFRGQWLVIETGSVTCGMYASNVDRINALTGDYPDVEFIVVYVREAHPGERIPQHKSMEDKTRAAGLLEGRLGEKRRVVVDSTDGEMHRQYSLDMPNIVYIVRPDGSVHYRCDWMHVSGLREALDNRGVFHFGEHAHSDKVTDRSVLNILKTIWNGGFTALWDFAKAMPELSKLHHEVDKYFEEHGQLKR